MEIILNGEKNEVPDICTVGQLIDSLDLRGKRFAIEVNLEIIPRSRYATQRLKAGDRVEIVNAIGGG
jgi:thiamine biosynthesis protein ThiS